ncbi:MAG: membrane dipeptidase [Lachnospiraceae bacterium]|nr:membrane dipeptidase [Lachnospiraceae bacterium]
MNIIDMHCDTIAGIYRSEKNGEKADLYENSMRIDLKKLRKGGWLLQNFACFVFLREGISPFEEANGMIDTFEKQMALYPDIIRPVTNCAQIEENRKAGIMSAMLTLEEGGICEGSIDNLKALYGRGARMMSLTWNFKNELAWPNRVMLNEDGSRYMIPETENGLTGTGREFVEAMEEMGMIVDVSHLGDAGILDVIDMAKKPFVASHSNARAVASNPRNLTDEMLKAMGEKGCVAGLNYLPDFLRDYGPDEDKTARIDDCVRMALYMKNAGGAELVGLGSDFDGFDDGMEWKDASGVPMIIDALQKAGFTSSEIDKITHENVLRLYKEILG